MNILAIDVGSSSMRGILFSQGNAGPMYSVRTPWEERGGNWIEQKPSRLREGLETICRAAAGEVVDAVSLTAFRSAPTLVDGRGEALCPFIMWRDKRNAAICRELEPVCSDLGRRCGAPLNTVFTGTKLTWLRRNAPSLWAKAHKALVVPDFLLFQMTGEFLTDTTYGSRSLLMDIRTRRWDPELCARFEVEEEKLCPLIPPGSAAGRLTGEFARRTGLPAGIPVISAGGDQQCAALGNGILDAGSVLINSGTGAYILRAAEEPEPGTERMICSVAATPGQYILECVVPACGSVINAWLERNYGDAAPDYGQLNRQLQAGGDRRAREFLEIYGRIAGEIASAFQALPRQGREAARVYLSGGLSGSGVYNAALANALGRTLYRRRNTQSTAVGAYVSAAVALGEFSNSREALEAVHGRGGDAAYGPSSGN